jgi:hypothetical protein
MVRLKIRKLSDGVTGVFRIVYDNEHIVIWKSLRKDASNDELVESDTTEFDVHQDTILWVEGIKPHGNTNGTIVALKLMDGDDQPVANAEDKIKIIVAEPVFALFATGATTGETTLRQYLNTQKKDARTSPYVVKGQTQSGQPTYYSVNVWHSEKLTKIALSTEGASIVIEGHANFGLGPAFQWDLSNLSAFMNVGTQYAAVDWNYLMAEGHPNLWIETNEIPVTVTNYTIPGPIGLCKFDVEDDPSCTAILTLDGSGYNRHHYLGPSGSNRLVVGAGGADLPQLRYKNLFYRSCYSYQYYFEIFQRGTMFCTTQECNPGKPVVREYVKGIVEGKNWNTLRLSLNQAEGDDIYVYHVFP